MAERLKAGVRISLSPPEEPRKLGGSSQLGPWANALYREIIRLAYNLVTAFQRNCLQESWQNLALEKLRYKLFLLPGELTRPQNRPVLRLKESPILQEMVHAILGKVHRLKPVQF